MPDREPATRHLRADELREQLDLLSEERKTTFFRRRAPREVADSISGPSERTVTMFDAGIRGLAGAPSLGAASVRELEAPSEAGQPSSGVGSQRGRSLSDTYRLPRLGKNGPLLAATAVLLGLAILAAAVAWTSSPRVSAERVVSAGSSPPAAPPLPAASDRDAPTGGDAPSVRDAPSPPGGAAGASSGPQAGAREPALSELTMPAGPSYDRRAPAAAAVPPASTVSPPSAARSGTRPNPVSARQAVELLLAGRTRAALDAYRALSAGPGSGAELTVVIGLLERELTVCNQNPGTERCAL